MLQKKCGQAGAMGNTLVPPSRESVAPPCSAAPTPKSSPHGVRSHILAMTTLPKPGNNTCNDGKDDPFGKDRPRDVRLQIYISMTLGVLAFLAFCVSTDSRRLLVCADAWRSTSGRGGRASMPRARSRTSSRPHSLIFPIPSLAG